MRCWSSGHRRHQGPGLGSDAEAFRTEVCGWLTEQLAPERTVGHDNPRDRTGLAESFERALAAEAGRRGWLGISVSAQFGGGGRPASFAAAFGYEAAYHDAPLIDTAIVLAGAPVMAFGNDEQRARLLPRMVSGEIEMCIAYTEPQAGNDLAALTSTATPQADGGYLLSGRKTLLTGADKADFCLTIARTDPSVPARRGSSMFLVDMRQSGVKVIPQRTMVGYDLFEIAFDDVTLPAHALLGTLGGGWRQLAYAVEQERNGIFNLGWCQRLFDEIHAFAREGDVGSRPIDDPVIADALAQLWVELGVGRRSAMKLVAEELSGTRSSATASIGKVVLTELAQRLAQFGTELAGPEAGVSGTLFGPVTEGAPARGRFGYEYLFRFDGSIGVGANEVHRTAIAALALGIRAERKSS
jgi:alkylation response protein AidB-like acyl-CoA dehydrogenase